MVKLFDNETRFITGSGEAVTLGEAVERIKAFLEGVEDYSVDVGSDSHTTGQTKVITAIAVHKTGKGGIFFHTSNQYDKMWTLRERIWRETELSLELARWLIEAFIAREMWYTVSIHADVGVAGKTSELIREIVGYVVGSGFPCQIKPEGYAACCVADKFSK